MVDSIKVSVIVPVYGVEKYIERCAHSLFRQSMKEGIEFIFINDMTLDHSIEILENVLEQYPERKEQVKIIHHDENRGLACTRKTGVLAASGEYLIHCDSDDWVEYDMYKELYQAAKLNDADIVGCDIIEEFKDKRRNLKQAFDIPQLQQCSLMLDVGSRKLERYMWNRMFRYSFYLTVGLKNPEINLWEDVCVTIPAHLLAKNIAYVPKAFYHYNRINTNSLVASFNQQKLANMIICGEYLKQLIEASTEHKSLKQALNNRLLACKLPYITRRNVFNPAIWRELWSNLHISTYPSLKMKILMCLASCNMDSILSKLIRNA